MKGLAAILWEVTRSDLLFAPCCKRSSYPMAFESSCSSFHRWVVSSKVAKPSR